MARRFLSRPSTRPPRRRGSHGSRLDGCDAAAPPAVCGTDGRGISLAPVLNVEGSEEESLALYRLLAVQQSLRVVRRSRYTFAGLRTPQARDLFRIADAAIVDRWVAVHTPGLLPALASARAVAAMQRRVTHPTPRVDPLERDVLRLLGAHPLSAVLDLPVDASAEECARWADRVAPGYRAEGHYRPIAPVFYWGEFLEPGRAGGAPWYGGMDDSSPRRTRRPRVAEMRRRPRARHAEDDEDDSATGAWVIRADEPQESVEDPFGLTRPADRDQDTDPEGLGDSLSELPEARVVRTPQPPVEVLRSGEPARVRYACRFQDPGRDRCRLLPRVGLQPRTLSRAGRNRSGPRRATRRCGMGDRVPGAACQARPMRP